MKLTNLFILTIYINTTLSLELSPEYLNFEAQIQNRELDKKYSKDAELMKTQNDEQGFVNLLKELFKEYSEIIKFITSGKDYINILTDENRKLGLSKNYLLLVLRQKFFDMVVFNSFGDLRNNSDGINLLKGVADDEEVNKVLDFAENPDLGVVILISDNDNLLGKGIEFKNEIKGIIDKIFMRSGFYDVFTDFDYGLAFDVKDGQLEKTSMLGDVSVISGDNEVKINKVLELFDLNLAEDKKYFYSTNTGEFKYENRVVV